MKSTILAVMMIFGSLAGSLAQAETQETARLNAFGHRICSQVEDFTGCDSWVDENVTDGRSHTQLSIVSNICVKFNPDRAHEGSRVQIDLSAKRFQCFNRSANLISNGKDLAKKIDRCFEKNRTSAARQACAHSEFTQADSRAVAGSGNRTKNQNVFVGHDTSR